MPRTEPTFRDARRDDYDVLCLLWRDMDELHASLLPGFFRRTDRPPRRREEFDAILRSPDESVRVAELHGEVVGVVHTQLYDTPPVAQMTQRRRAHVDSVVIAQRMRRQGLGTQLMHEAYGWARAHGAAEILLTVWAGNEAAEKFYETLGFHRVNMVLSVDL
jgi:ribosomal protein S18 acetylase RimI-like enzyme